MPAVVLSRGQVRQLVSPILDDYYIGQADSGSATTVVVAALAGYGDDFFINMRLTVVDDALASGTNVNKSRQITAYTSSSGSFTFATMTTANDATTKFEIHNTQSGWPTIERYNAAINDAVLELGSHALISQDDTYICLQRDRRTYPIPVGDFTISGTADSGSTTTLVDAQLVGYGTNYFNGDELVTDSGTGAGQRLRITAFTDATGAITFATATAPAAGTTYRIIRRNKAPKSIVIKPLIEGIGYGGDRHYSYEYNSSQNFRAASGNARIAQGFQITTGREVAGDWYQAVWIPMRKIDYPTGDLIAELQTDSSGKPPDTTPVFVDDPSGTQVGPYSRRVDIAGIPNEYTFIRFQFVKPVWIVYNTQYHIVIRGADNDTVSTSDYLQVAVDTDGQYTYGNLSTGTTTPTWTAVAGSDIAFRLEPLAFTEYELQPKDWRVLQGERKIQFIGQPVDGTIVRIRGQRPPELTYAEGSPVEVNAAAIANIAAGYLVASVPSQGPTGSQINVSVILQRGERSKSEIIVPIIPGAKLVEVG